MRCVHGRFSTHGHVDQHIRYFLLEGLPTFVLPACREWNVTNSRTKADLFEASLWQHRNVRLVKDLLKFMALLHWLEVRRTIQPKGPFWDEYLLLLLAHLAGGVWLLENPSSSLLFKHGRMVWLVRKLHKAGMMVSRTALIPGVVAGAPVAACFA